MTDLNNGIKLVADDTKAVVEQVGEKAQEAGAAAAVELHEIAKKVDDKVTPIAEKASS